MPLSSKRSLASCLVILVSNTIGAVSFGQSNFGSEMSDVVKSWRETQAQIHSGVFEWHSQRYFSSQQIRHPVTADYPPPKGSVRHLECKFLFKGSMLRFEQQGRYLNRHGKLEDQRTVYTWNGERGVDIHEVAEVKTVSTHVGFPRINSSFRPIQYAFRMNEPSWYVFQRHQYRFIDAAGTSRTDASLSQVRLRDDYRPKSGHAGAYTLRNDQDYSIVRYLAGKPGKKLTLDIAINYQSDANHAAWVPMKWAVSGDLCPFTLELSTVTTYQLNVELSDTLFESELPANAESATNHRIVGEQKAGRP